MIKLNQNTKLMHNSLAWMKMFIRMGGAHVDIYVKDPDEAK